MKKSTLLLILLIAAVHANAQQYPALWKFTSSIPGKPVLQPKEYRGATVDESALTSFLDGITINATHPLVIGLPAPDGAIRPFYIWETPVMEQPLADKYTSIHTYTASAVDNHLATAKIDYTPFGFHAMVVDGSGTFFIDPFGKNADGNYITYYRRNYNGVGSSGICGVGEDPKSVSGTNPVYHVTDNNNVPQIRYRLSGTTRRTYRLALACTGEYAVAVAGSNPTKAAVLAKMVTTINRVNSVYERDLAITMQLVSNNDTLIFLDGSNDPYADSRADLMLGQNQQTVDARIKPSNYDIGHVFGTGAGGGGSGLGVALHGVCDNNTKAQGVTGTPTPTGDAFDIDYVAHEMGHQYGAEHTFNSFASGSCSNLSAVQASAFEPGSGSTIMAYAGICGSENIQRNTDPYFHSVSLEEIISYVSINTCAVLSSSGNTNATLPAFTASYSIPFLTAFELTAPTATDATADTVNYCWEQRDLGDFGRTINQTRLKGPLFRSFLPTASRTRIFPSIDSLLKSVFASKQEKVPDTSRTLCFRLTQRDIFHGFGCFNFPDDSIHLNVIHTGTPFRVTSPNASTNWVGGSTQTVLWNVSRTDLPPISCANVDISLSTDGGYTFPTLLVGNTPNDGSENITLPAGNMSNMRIKVKGAGNVFFAISHTIPPTAIEKRPITTPGVTILPIPANKLLEVRFIKSGESSHGKIENALGQLIWKGEILGQQVIDVSSWARGIYYLRLYNDSTINITRPIVVQ